MRHLGSVALALLLAPLAFVLIGRGLGGLVEVASEAPEAEQTDYFAIVTASAATGLAGLILALLTMARFSPLGPTLAGAGLLTIGVWFLLDRERVLDAIPHTQLGLSDDRFDLAATVAPLIAVPMLVTLFIPRRWRGRGRLALVAAPTADSPPPPAVWPGTEPPTLTDGKPAATDY
ncbi:MAG TPA: hypothetical protein VIL37_05065 [Natronosporangium sp.]